MTRVALITSIIILALLAGLYLFTPLPSDSSLPSNKSYGRAQVGGPFEATNHLGEPFTQSDLKGHYSLIYFGFTYCPDICPAGLMTISNTLDSLPKNISEQVLPIFVSVDPERDTVEIMKQYVENFHEQIIGLTGTPEQMAAMAKAYKVYFNKSKTEAAKGADYLVDHSGYFYLMGPDGNYLQHFPHNVSVRALADALRSHIQD